MIYYIVEFIFVVTVSYFFYYTFFIKKNKKPLEFSYLEKRYNLKLDKIDKKQLGKTIAIINSVLIAIIFVSIDFIKNVILQLLVGFIGIILLTVIAYYFIAKYYEKKGLTKRCTITEK